MKFFKIILTFSAILFSIAWVHAEEEKKEATCNYISKINECMAAQGSPRSISDFTCINGSKEEVTYQVILDDTFSSIDTEVEKYISDLEANKSQYFWANKEADYVEWIEDITRIFDIDGKYGEKYSQACGITLIKEVQQCSDNKSVSNAGIPNYLKEGSACKSLAQTKLAIYKKVSFNILALNKLQIRKDEHKLYVQQERGKYDKLIDNIMVNIGYLERMWAKWPSKTKNAH